MTVREVVELLRTAKAIQLCYGVSAVSFDKDDMLQMAAYGDYAVHSIEGCMDDHYEISVLMRPVRGGEV